MTQRRLAVLGYHKIGPWPSDGWETWFYVPEPTFASHLRLIETSGWQVVDLATVLAGLADPTVLPARSVLLTFDDGYRSMRTVALPHLRAAGWPAVLFVPTDHVGGTSAFDESEPVEALCDWEDLRALTDGGVDVQSHAASHRGFSELDAGTIEDEARRSRKEIESRLGHRVRTIAYPYGDLGREPERTWRTLRSTGYVAAFGYPGEVATLPLPYPFHVPRVAVGPDTDMTEVLAAEAATAAGAG